MSKAESSSSWRKFGTDKDYQAWCRRQPSAYSGEQHQIVYAHYRTAANSGTGFKPPFSGIPLTDREHREQHRIGTFAFMPREWWEAKVAEHLHKWSRGEINDS